MKKFVFPLLFVIALISIPGFSQLPPKPLKGFYVKFTLTGAQNIWCEDIILYPKVVPPSPTTWYFAWVDTSITINIARLNIDQVAKFTYTLELYYDYYEYWNYFSPFRLRVNPSFITDWVDIMDGDGYTLENSTALQIAEGVAAKFNIPIEQIQILNYY